MPDVVALPKLGRAAFSKIADLIYEDFGLAIKEDKFQLVEGRLQRFLVEEGFGSFDDYVDDLVRSRDVSKLSELANRLTTNHTFFYREKAHFDFLTEKGLPRLLALMGSAGERELRIWCAGCSFGDEPYTMAIVLEEFFKGREGSLDWAILATDLSERALECARAGVYEQDRISTLPAPWKLNHFSKMPDGRCQVKEGVKKKVIFRRFNLMNLEFPFKKRFHLILCRNVMIYFDQKTRDDLANRFYGHLVEGGFLFTGHSETITKGVTRFEYVCPAIFRKGKES